MKTRLNYLQERFLNDLKSGRTESSIINDIEDMLQEERACGMLNQRDYFDRFNKMLDDLNVAKSQLKSI